MSLLERLGRGHLSDSQFAKYWAEGKTEGAVHPHLATCEACRARYDRFEAWVAGVGAELRNEADEAFTPERLAVQQSQIARRLETLERPARVIAFPKAARAVISGHSHVRRWVTAAAAAGLIAGAGLGELLPLHHANDARTMGRGPVFTAQESKSRAEQIRADQMVRPASYSQSDDELLSDAFASPRVSTLSALDDMTPHVRDLVDTGK